MADETTTPTVTTEDRIAALAKHLGCEADSIETSEYQPGNGWQFEAEGGEYLVMTDEEADKAVKERILDDVWATNTSFLMGHLNIKADDWPDTMKSVKAVQEKCCEGCNALLRAALKDEDEFVRAVVSADGRGHTLAGYDHEENEERVGDEWLYIYRTN
jgi:hypothetical protein